jgi:hypothetical protein
MKKRGKKTVYRSVQYERQSSVSMAAILGVETQRHKDRCQGRIRHIFLKCKETQRWREQFLNDK